MLFFRIIILLSIIIIFLFGYNYCSSAQNKNSENSENSGYDIFLQEALKRNSPPSTSREVSFSMEEFFGNQSQIYLRNKYQRALQKKLRDNFQGQIFGDTKLFSLEQSERDIEMKLERENRLNTPTLETGGERRDSETQNSESGSFSGASGICAGIIFDPCIVVGEDTPPDGIIKFGTWRHDLPI